MARIMVVIVGVMSGVGGFATVAALAPSKYNYAEASEERQQRSLDTIAKGFEVGFNATSGGIAEIKRIRTSAETDTISVDIRFVKPEVENAGAIAIGDFRKGIYKYNCGFLAKKSVLQAGVTLKIHMPSQAAQC